MHTNLDLLLTLTGGLAAALVLGYLAHRLGLSPLVGYLLAGVVVGPNTPGFVADRHLAEQLAEVGVILLMFGVGMHFHIEELWAVRAVAIPGAVAQSAVATGLGVVIGLMMGWTTGAGLVFGLALSVASTVVLTRVLADNNELHTRSGHVAIGWLVVEDLFTVVVLVVLPAAFSGGAVVSALGWASVKIVALVLLTFVLGGRLIPWVFVLIARTRSRELFTVCVLVVALGLALGSAKVFGVSMALGAFLAGMVVGRSDFSVRAAGEALPLRDAFAVLFFVSAGMLFDPKFLWREPLLVALTFGVVVIGKSLAALLIVLLLRYPWKVALSVAFALAQIGEFSFILGDVGKKLGVMPDEAFHALVAVAIVSIAINPLLYRLVKPLDRLLSHKPGPDETPVSPSSGHRAVVVGYGPVGRTLSRILLDNGIEPTVVEMNVETVRQLRLDGIPAVYGDAGNPATLAAAGLAQASGLFLSSSGLPDADEIIRQAKTLNPSVRVLVRCVYLREADPLRAAGADDVFAGEGEVALAMAENVLRELGAVPEQIDRERDRVRRELFGED